jgi:hypothetical protein
LTLDASGMCRAARAGMKIRVTTLGSWMLVSGLLMAVGCSAAEEVTNTVECSSVCKRYSECFDADFDVEGCTDRCEDEADASENREQRLEACNACIDDRSCSSATFNCATECAGVVP